VSFVFGGCGGNANSFESFEDCSLACGAPDQTGCPALMPASGSECAGPDHPCDYDSYDCSCTPTSATTCEPVNPGCGPIIQKRFPEDRDGECVGEGCIAEIVVNGYVTCACEGAAWNCVPGGV
jgi:hypothetical protein